MASYFSRFHSLSFFNRLSLVTLISIFLVIFAGIFVRVTGSGMGCPDWPKCFGLLVPPFSEEQVTWRSGKLYSKGQMVIENDVLWQASLTHTSSGSEFSPVNWYPYTKHDYTEFNPFHTWVEYINRCLGAISGVFILMLFFSCLIFKNIPRYFLGVSFALIFLSLVQYLLGRNVVYSVLESQKISLHFFVALIFVPLLLFIFYKSKYLLHYSFKNNIKQKSNFKIQSKYLIKINILLKKHFYHILYFSLFISLIQMFFGTQVRGNVEQDISNVLTSFELFFHRLLVPVILLVNIFLVFGLNFLQRKIYNPKVGFEKISLILILVSLIASGSYMYLFEIPSLEKPKWSTLIHAYSSVILFSVYVSLVLKKFIFKLKY